MKSFLLTQNACIADGKYESAWHYHTATADFVHFTSDDNLDVCDGNSVKLTNSANFGIPHGLVMCKKFFDIKQTPLLSEFGIEPPASEELGAIDYAPGLLIEELLRVKRPYGGMNSGNYGENTQYAHMICVYATAAC